MQIIVHGIKFADTKTGFEPANDAKFPCHQLPTAAIKDLLLWFSEAYGREAIALDVSVVHDDTLDRIGEWAERNPDNEWIQTLAKIKSREVVN